MAYTEKDLKRFLSSELKPEDTFQFECKICGNCCRQRSEPILLTGADVYRVAQALGISTGEVVEQKARCYLGDASHVPVVVLKERQDGSCSLLRNGRCMVQSGKPAVCALYPLGRWHDQRDGKFHYFMNNQTCQSTCDDRKVWTLQEWLDNFHIKETEPLAVAWNKLVVGLSSAMSKVKKKDVSYPLFQFLFSMLYLGYDTTRPYQDQVQERLPIIERILQYKFHINVSFK